MNESGFPSKVVVKVTSEPIDISEGANTPTPEDGALVVFSGIVRQWSEGRAVSGLSYEAYDLLARQQMAEIGRRAQDEYGASSVFLVHRTGEVKPGEVSVVAAASAPHREAAFAACRFCIDAIKQQAAIWKKETFADGDSRWAAGG